MAASKRTSVERDLNEDPITGEPGSHPVGAGVGAAMAGAAAGAAGGAIGGPVGAAAGAVIGGIAGGLGGKAVAEQLDPTVESAYWESEYENRPYFDDTVGYDTYEPAYRYGWEGRTRYQDRTFEAAEADLRRDWEKSEYNKSLNWNKAKHAARDAWNRTEKQCADPRNRDRC